MDTKKLRQKILDLAIRGKLVPQDPNDEPASVLLERIREEKERLIEEGKIKRPKKSSKSADTSHYQNVPFEIPDSWEWTTIGELFQHNTGKALNNSNGQDGVLKPYLTTSNVYWNNFDFNEVKQMYFKDTEIEKCTVAKGDLLVCEGGDIGRAAIWEYDYTICIQNHIHRLRPYVKIRNELYLYFLMLYKWTDRIQGKGIGLQGLSSGLLDKLIIPLPPCKEQNQIVSAIEKWFNLIDILDYEKADLETSIKQTKSKILELAIRGKLVSQNATDQSAISLLQDINPNFTPCDTSHYANLPDSWCAIPLGSICSLAEGEVIESHEYRYIDVKGLRTGNYTTKMFGKYVQEGTTLILVDGENSGEVFHTPFEGYQGSTMKVLNISNYVDSQYVLYFVKLYQKALRDNKVGSAIPHLNKKMFRELIIPLPPQKEQRRIVKAIEQYYNVIDYIRANL